MESPLALFTPLQKTLSIEIQDSKSKMLSLLQTISPVLCRSATEEPVAGELCLNLCSEFERIAPKSEASFQKLLEEIAKMDQTRQIVSFKLNFYWEFKQYII
jgi:hypothetical protein